MPFNSNTYHMNKARRLAKANLEWARIHKTRLAEHTTDSAHQFTCRT